MTNKTLILLLIIIVAVYLALERKSYPVPPVPPPSAPLPKKEVRQSGRPKINRVEDDPIITLPDISYHPARIQALIRLMWIDLRKMLKFKNEVDYYDTERWYKKKDVIEALSFTTYSEFNYFYQKWKGSFDFWPEWEKYLEEWKSLGGKDNMLYLDPPLWII